MFRRNAWNPCKKISVFKELIAMVLLKDLLKKLFVLMSILKEKLKNKVGNGFLYYKLKTKKDYLNLISTTI